MSTKRSGVRKPLDRNARDHLALKGLQMLVHHDDAFLRSTRAVTLFYRPFQGSDLENLIQGRRATLRCALAPGYLLPRLQR